MSRVGKKIIQIPSGVTVEQKDGKIFVSGPKGKLERAIHPLVTVKIENGAISVSVRNENVKSERSLWGTFSSHIQNMVEGVTKGYKRSLEINGVGFRVAMQCRDIKLEVGFSHPVIYKVPAIVTASVEKNVINLESFDKEVLGNTAAEIRAIKKPEPYKGKGIKYSDEVIRRKVGKTAAKA